MSLSGFLRQTLIALAFYLTCLLIYLSLYNSSSPRFHPPETIYTVLDLLTSLILLPYFLLHTPSLLSLLPSLF
ncbi:hypothetical protein F5Y17DRAFT_442057 [Xylariaceae sp. FL0594]|nr:hypothetical protein F5Y17DRAFT_442057 [Xylariaceae sp. FL0594]